ncbi:DUF2526 family protein [Moellerella wisconsensis]|uniref:Uncharacterized protein n=1 Tax=Moellerella wisconsensis ATCC 35017 TaxID=1354267 RepID=A0A0N1KI83_9GAMM|nr:DUF2526 family protein [Moellerella wisconsensis]KPD02234.1 hypothetical protein M992_2228 [Moellerella wisconsensis ATCC 35017]VFS53887.1 Protein of uncharacterised function (DUF2526) [Moellerella wisconsensis]
MNYYDEIKNSVDARLKENSITEMNILLTQLSHDQKLTQEQRFEQQQRLREAIFTHHETK